MRIVAGEYKGRVLKAPSGQTARPTTDRVREALMSVLISARGTLDGAVVLDAFAGSGALGLEALSRGAAHVSFCEKNGAVFHTLRANLDSFAVPDARYTLFQTDILKHTPKFTKTPFDLVFLDPPYGYKATDVLALLERMEAQGLLAAETLISYEHAKSDDLSVRAAFDSLQWDIVAHKSYGDIALDLALVRHQKREVSST